MKQIGRYHLDEVEGFGAFATVWRGVDSELEIPVAVKVLAENWPNHADVRQRCLAEARGARPLTLDPLGVGPGELAGARQPKGVEQQP